MSFTLEQKYVTTDIIDAGSNNNQALDKVKTCGILLEVLILGDVKDRGQAFTLWVFRFGLHIVDEGKNEGAIFNINCGALLISFV